MWPFKKPSKDGDGGGTLSRRLDDLESDHRRLRGEWDDTLERLGRLTGRIAKREARAAGIVAEEPAEAPHQPRPSAAMQQVMKRRANHVGPAAGG